MTAREDYQRFVADCNRITDKEIDAAIRTRPQAAEDKPMTDKMTMRPSSNNADEWAVFLEEYGDSKGFCAVQIAEALDAAWRAGQRNMRERARMAVNAVDPCAANLHLRCKAVVLTLATLPELVTTNPATDRRLQPSEDQIMGPIMDALASVAEDCGLQDRSVPAALSQEKPHG